jgi:hypothetical protein
MPVRNVGEFYQPTLCLSAFALGSPIITTGSSRPECVKRFAKIEVRASSLNMNCIAKPADVDFA